MDPQPPDQDPVLAMMAADATGPALGIELADHGPGWAHVRMTVRPDMVNGHHIAHGGMVFTLADTAFACACNSWGPAAVAAGCEITFVAPAREGDVLDARAEVRTRFGRRGICDVTVTRRGTQPGEGDEVVAELRGHSQELRAR
ncbi:hydroxyphenylacetyl-CoA thioesterase PaaI [Rhodococcus aerolatus]